MEGERGAALLRDAWGFLPTVPKRRARLCEASEAPESASPPVGASLVLLPEIPLGSLKRYLRDGLSSLRTQLA